MKKLLCIIFFALFFLNGFAQVTEPNYTTYSNGCSDISHSNCIEISECNPEETGKPCLVLDQANTYYLLTEDLTTEKTGIIIKKDNTTLDLGGHTLTFGNSDVSGIPNSGFETGTSSGWDLSNAPNASIVSTNEFPMLDNYALKITAPSSGNEIVSGTTQISVLNREYSAYAVIDSSNESNIRMLVEGPNGGTVCDQTGMSSGAYHRGDVMTCDFTPTTAGNYKIHIIGVNLLKDDGRTDTYIDNVNIGPKGDVGIFSGWSDSSCELAEEYIQFSNNGRPNNVKITNGRIVQGSPYGINNKGIYLYSNSSGSYEISNIYSESSGTSSVNILASQSSNNDVHNNAFQVNSIRLISRESLRNPLSFVNGENIHFYNNEIEGGEGGIILNRISGGTIHDNEVRVNTTVTNHYSIQVFAANNIDIYNNFVQPIQGDGIYFGTSFNTIEVYNINIFNNTVILSSHPCNTEYVREFSTPMLRATDYLKGTAHDNKVYGNVFDGTAIDYSYRNCFSRIRGFFINLSGPNNEFYDNTIITKKQENSQATAIVAGGTATIKNNYIESDQYFTLIGGGYSPSYNYVFQDNRFIKTENPDYEGIIIGGFNGSAGGIQGALNNYFINNSFENGASLEDISYSVNEDKDLWIQWYLNIKARDAETHNPIQNAQIEIRKHNSTGKIIFTGTTDSEGKIETQTLTEYYEYAFGTEVPERELYSPYYITGEYNEQEINQLISLNQSKTVYFDFTLSSCSEGETQNCTTPENCPGTQTCTNGTWELCKDIAGDNCPADINPSIIVTQINPVSDISVEQGKAFPFSTSVTCLDNDCGNIEAVLDPEINSTVNQGTDDIWVYGTSINTSTDFGEIGHTGTQPEAMAFRFNNIQIPRESTINSAVITLTSRSAMDSQTVNVILKSQVDDNPATFSTYSDYSSRTKSNSSIEWNNVPAFIYAGTYNTPDLSSIIQETINKSYWQEGDSIVIFIEDNGSSAGAERRIVTYDSPWFEDGQAKLTINYETGKYKGQISTTTGVQPFYTTSLNPQICSNMTAGETCTNTWQVIPTGEINETYTFFVDYIPENNEIDLQQTTKLNITISESGECMENWDCTDWSECINGTQTRTCIDLSDCGTTNNKPIETQTCLECNFGERRDCTTTESCPGLQVCVQGYWSDCEDVPDDNCPVLSCSEGEITESCYCGDNVYDSGYCCRNEHRETTCPTDCPQGQITEECYCGTETYTTGYCCTEQHQSNECQEECIEDWSCPDWTTIECINATQTRTCIDLNDCGTTEFKPAETQSCGNCTTGQTTTCYTNQGCQGTQTCINSFWQECIDIPNDGCPSENSQPLKEFTINIQPATTKEGETFTITITHSQTPIINAKIEYAKKTYYTKSNGTIKTQTKKDYTQIKISKTGYKTKTINLILRTDKCGNQICEKPYETQTSCPADCKQPEKIKELKIYVFKTENTLIIKITDTNEKEIENAKVSYGTKTKYTNTQGLVNFIELIQPETIKAEKPGYKTTQKTHNPKTTCIENTTKNCTTKECPGTQTCTNGTWTNCIDTPNDNCPKETEKETSLTTITLSILLVIGIIIMIITKLNSR